MIKSHAQCFSPNRAKDSVVVRIDFTKEKLDVATNESQQSLTEQVSTDSLCWYHAIREVERNGGNRNSH
ncbi:MAG: hypothetical protein NZ805_10855 [Armatimonadetes bacterium]|nr:hypothetical protein [Armatimonadota bacterium]MDW8029148.1 hypothetical protein [Armatimonadota bacterium]